MSHFTPDQGKRTWEELLNTYNVKMMHIIPCNVAKVNLLSSASPFDFGEQFLLDSVQQIGPKVPWMK